MRRYTYSYARQHLSELLEQASIDGEIEIYRQDGHTYRLASKAVPAHLALLWALLIVALVVLLSALAERGATQHATTGTVADFKAGQWLIMASDVTGQPGFRFILNATTTYDSMSDPAVIKRGARVTVWYRSVGESRPVVDKVRLLDDAEPH